MAGRRAPVVRRAAHAGSWYSEDRRELEAEIDGFLLRAPRLKEEKGAVRGVVGPHAGYRFCGRTLGSAYAHLPTKDISRVVVLGPAHRVALDLCVLTTASVLATPVGDLAVDREAVLALHKTGLFDWFDLRDDEEEHSIEMHLPFIVRHFARAGAELPRVVPIVVGSLSAAQHRAFAESLRPLLADPGTVFAISSDFCHWGARFRFTAYDPRAGAIHQSIEAMDREGMAAIASRDPARFREYISRTRNTICGRHAFSILLELLPLVDDAFRLDWSDYTQSSRVTDIDDSSVSYAAGVLASTRA